MRACRHCKKPMTSTREGNTLRVACTGCAFTYVKVFTGKAG